MVVERRRANPRASAAARGRPSSLAQHRVRGPRRAGSVLGGRDAPDARGQTGLREDRLGEIGPGAVAGGGDVVDAEGQMHDLLRRLGQMARVGRAAPLVGDDRHLVALAAEAQHRPHEVLRRLAEQPRAADDPRLAAGRRLAVQLRTSVGAERSRRVRLQIRRGLPAVEDVVRRERDERRAELGRHAASLRRSPRRPPAAPPRPRRHPSRPRHAGRATASPELAGGGSVTSQSARVRPVASGNASSSECPSCPAAPVTRVPVRGTQPRRAARGSASPSATDA